MIKKRRTYQPALAATISKRLGDATTGITLNVYARRFQRDDGKAAAAINAVIKW